ncbi:GyrI-like domain-containing protein [Sediminispirochaeta bajacaliforniensis]|uniref:GyrI-like domain-containing protein n=1 Tax=Sediminispirochaeta bajacaliforniensis TaxID=148 RepID=UPI00036798FF|nr:GyrI-like domain-containing protein [Sediminispirochaeta bajacaliforniensis]
MEIKDLKEQNILAVRLTTSVKELPNALGLIYKEVASYMEANNISFAGVPFTIYHNMDMEALDIEAGFPTLKKEKAHGRIQAGTIPAIKVASTIHTGPYSTMGETYDHLQRFTSKKGCKVLPWMWESYLNDPETVAPEALKTEIFFPLEG